MTKAGVDRDAATAEAASLKAEMEEARAKVGVVDAAGAQLEAARGMVVVLEKKLVEAKEQLLHQQEEAAAATARIAEVSQQLSEQCR